MTASHTNPGTTSRADHSVLAALTGAADRVGAGVYQYDPEGPGFVIASALSFASASAEHIRAALALPELVERVVPRVAATGRAESLPDLARSVGVHSAGPVGSAYFVCLAEPDPKAPVLALLCPEPNGFGPVERALADTLARHSLLSSDRKRELDTQIQSLVRGLEAIGREVEALGIGIRESVGAIPPELTAALRTLSPREREVLHGLQAGQRVTTLARGLFISAHTVRNHLKSIFRKLGVRSQVELLERLGPTPHAAAAWASTQPGPSDRRCGEATRESVTPRSGPRA